MTTDDFTDNIYYEIFINENNYRYFLSSRSVIASSSIGGINFCIYTVAGGRIAADDISKADGIGEQDSFSFFRPVIALNSNVTVTEGDGQSPETA